MTLQVENFAAAKRQEPWSNEAREKRRRRIEMRHRAARRFQPVIDLYSMDHHRHGGAHSCAHPGGHCAAPPRQMFGQIVVDEEIEDEEEEERQAPGACNIS